MTANLAQGNPEISVLMSCYNGSRWLAEAIDSVLAQTCNNFEFILVDDGSRDNSLEIIRAYAARDARIVVLPKKNTGLADSLNKGLALAKGTWIARIDIDDLCEPCRLERQLAFAYGQPGLVLIGSGFAEIDEKGNIIKKHHYPDKHERLVTRLERRRGFFPHSSAFFRAEVARRVGGYNTRITRAEDCRLWLNLSLQGKIACLPECLVRIRKHTDQISLDNKGMRQFCDGTAATVCHFLQKMGCKDPSVHENGDEWIAFLSWVENRIEHLGIFERRKAWSEARTVYLATKNKSVAVLRFGTRLLQSGYAPLLVWEKFFGTSLPKRLAEEWLKL